MLRKRYCLALVIFLCFGTSLKAAEIYVSDTSGNIGIVESCTGSVVPGSVFNPGAGPLTDIAFAPDGTLYGITFTKLYTINSTLHTATEVATLGSNLAGNPKLGGANALVFSPDGTLYAASSGAKGIFRVNPSDGTATLINGTVTVGADSTPNSYSSGDLAFLGDYLYWTTDSLGEPSSKDWLVRFKISGDQASDYNNLGDVREGWSYRSTVYGLFALDGKLYGIDGCQIYEFNYLNYSMAVVKPIGSSFYSQEGLDAVYGVAVAPSTSSVSCDLIYAVMALKVVAGITSPDNLGIITDVNEDGQIGLPEAIHILQKAAGLR